MSWLDLLATMAALVTGVGLVVGEVLVVLEGRRDR